MTNKSIRQQFADTMLEIGKNDPNLVVMVGDISHFALQPFAEACPGRFYNIGILEPTMISMAAGFAKVGLIPVAHTIAPFILERAFEQLKLDFCYHKLPGNIVTVGSAFDYSNLGCTHHCYGDFALLKTLQNTEILYPASTLEFDSLFRQRYQSDTLTFYRIPSTTHGISIAADDIKFGKGVKIKDGKDITLISTGPLLGATLLAAQDLDADVVYIHSIKPLDTVLVRESVSKTRNVLVIEEHMENGGLGDDVLRTIKDIQGVKHRSLSIPNTFITEYGSYREQCDRLGFSKDGILKKIETEFNLTKAI